MRNSIPEVFRCISLMLKPRVGFVNPGFCSRHGDNTVRDMGFHPQG